MLFFHNNNCNIILTHPPPKEPFTKPFKRQVVSSKTCHSYSTVCVTLCHYQTLHGYSCLNCLLRTCQSSTSWAEGMMANSSSLTAGHKWNFVSLNDNRQVVDLNRFNSGLQSRVLIHLFRCERNSIFPKSSARTLIYCLGGDAENTDLLLL